MNGDGHVRRRAGRTNGGAILLTTKSGTNALHGSLYYIFRAERFNAKFWSNNYVRPGARPAELLDGRRGN